jgi:hypothetical protein
MTDHYGIESQRSRAGECGLEGTEATGSSS